MLLKVIKKLPHGATVVAGTVGHSRIIDELAINDIAAILFLLCGFREIGGKSVDSRREYG